MASYYEVDERESAQYTITLNDETGLPVPASSLTSLTLTLYDVATGTILNSRNSQNVLNANNGTYHATSGLLTWSVQSADNQIISTALDVEVHRAMFVYVWNAGQGVHEIEIRVANKSKLT